MSVRVIFSRKLYRELFETRQLLDTNDASANATSSFTRSDNTTLLYFQNHNFTLNRQLSVRVIFSRKLYRELFTARKLLDTNDASANATSSFTRSDNTTLLYFQKDLSIPSLLYYLLLCTIY